MADGTSGVGGGADPSQADGRIGFDGDVSGYVGQVDGRGHLSRGDVARTDESRDVGGIPSVDTGPHDGCVVGGDWPDPKSVGDGVNGYSLDGDGYSDDSFAPDGDSDGRHRNHEDSCKPDECSSRLSVRDSSDFQDDTAVDAIPSTLVETGRRADD